MKKFCTVYELKKGMKRAKFREGLKHTLDTAKCWIIDNKEVVVTVAPICIGTIATGIKFVCKNANLSKQKDIKELYCYDPSLGHYWKLRRRLTNNDWLKINSRKKNGEKLGDILDDLRVLK